MLFDEIVHFFSTMLLSFIFGTLMWRFKPEKEGLVDRSVSCFSLTNVLEDLDSSRQVLAQTLKRTKRLIIIALTVMRDWFDRLQYFVDGPNLINRQYGKACLSAIPKRQPFT